MYTVAIIPSTVGFYWEEVFDAFKEFKEAGWDTDFYTVNGKEPVADPNSLKMQPILSLIGIGANQRMSPKSVTGRQLQAKLSSAKNIAALDTKTVDAIYIPGGHGCLFDVCPNEIVHTKIREMFGQQKIIAAVCHGSSCLAFVKNGEPIVKNKKITGFPDLLDAMLIKFGLVNKSYLPLPYKNEQKMKQAGAKITPLDSFLAFINPTHYVVDLPFITGVGPKSVTKVARKVVDVGQEKTP